MTAPSFSPVADVPHVTVAGSTIGADCFAQVASLQGTLRPSWRIHVGSILLYCQDLRHPEQVSYWQRPWMQHAWLVDADGCVHDPALWNLESWAEVQDCALPCSIEQMQARVVTWSADMKEQSAVVNELMNCPFNMEPAEQLVYLPGCVFTAPSDVIKPSRCEMQAWGALAVTSAKHGGFTADELNRGLKTARELLVPPPPVRPRNSSHKRSALAEISRLQGAKR